MGQGGDAQYNIYNDATGNGAEYKDYISYGGEGRSGMMQFFGVRGNAFSKLKNAGIVLTNSSGDILKKWTAAAISEEGNNQNDDTRVNDGEPISIRVPGTTDPNSPKIYYLKYTAEMAKNNDRLPQPTIVSSTGAQIEVILDDTDVANIPSQPKVADQTNPPDEAEVNLVDVYAEPGIDAEVISNPVPCSVTFDVTTPTNYENILGGQLSVPGTMPAWIFTKDPNQSQGLGPDSFTICLLYTSDAADE